MKDDGGVGQYVAKVLSLVGALITGDPIEIRGHGDVQVTGILRDPWPDSPVMVRLVGADGLERAQLDHVEIVG